MCVFCFNFSSHRQRKFEFTGTFGNLIFRRASTWTPLKKVALTPRMARQGEVIPLITAEINAYESSTNEPHEQTSVLTGTSFLATFGDRTRDISKSDIAMITTTPSAHFWNTIKSSTECKRHNFQPPEQTSVIFAAFGDRTRDLWK